VDRRLPDVGFHIAHGGGPHPVKVRIRVALAQGDMNYGLISSVQYNGNALWNLNPGFAVSGHFAIPTDAVNELPQNAIRARIDVTVVDIYERHHKLLSVGYVLTGLNADWYLEPSEQVLDIREGPATS
jgi:hypothetical protein